MVTENQTALEEMVRLAQRADEPGARPGTVIHKGSDDSAKIEVLAVSSAGYCWIYDTQSAEPSRVNRNMLLTKLKQTRADGSYVFTTVKPSFSPKRGTFQCLLSPSNPERERYSLLGFGTCPKSNLTSPMQVELHMQHCHKTEWRTIQQEKVEKEKSEERELRKLLLTNAANSASVKDTEKQNEFTCDECEKSFSSHIALTGHKRTHLKVK